MASIRDFNRADVGAVLALAKPAEAAKIRREALDIASHMNASNAWIGTPGWHFTRILDRLACAEEITGDNRVKGLKAEVIAMRAALLELLPRIEVVLGEAAEALERQYAATAAR